MINRFKKFLENEFRSIAPSEQAMDYREEILGTLLDRAQEYRIKGMEDEDMIYNLCIESLGDFRVTLKDFELKREALKKTAAKSIAIILSVAAAVIVLTIGYLAVSFVTKAWDKTWLIEVGGILIYAVIGLIIPMPLLIQKNKATLLKVIVSGIVSILTVFTYLVLLVMTSIAQSWLVFLSMPIAILGAIVVVSLFTNSKTLIGELMAFVQTTSALVYVILALRGAIDWTPYWLLPVAGAVVNIGIAVTMLIAYHKKKVAKRIKTAEDYYTSWRE